MEINGLHVTYHYTGAHSTPKLPDGINEGDKQEVKILAKFRDDKGNEALLVALAGLGMFSPFSDTIFHVTMVASTMTPKEVGVAASFAFVDFDLNKLSFPKEDSTLWGTWTIKRV